MTQIYANNFITLVLGRRGENLARKVVFDIRDLESLYGTGDVEVIYQRPGDAQPYPLTVQREGTLVTWDVTSTDTEMSDGSGKCELRYYAGETLAKSKTWRTLVEPAMDTPSETTPPEPEQGWVDQIIAVGAAAKASEGNAAGSASAAADSATAAQTAQSGAEAAQSAAEQSAQEAAESAAVYDTVVADVTQLKQDIAAITPDDTTVDGKPWTSKKIVDSLCMPFEESGNPVQCYPVENYPLGVKVSWEPVQQGSGDPSPENIRPIKGRDSVKVERCGENLLNIKPFNKFTKNGITFEYVPDGGIHIYGTATASADGPVFPVWHLPPGKYYGLNTVSGIPASFVVQRNGKPLRLNAKGIFEILAGDITKYWYALVAADGTVDETIYPYIVPGTTAPTTYEPYTGSTTDIALPETVYGGELDAVTGVLTVEWTVITLDGDTLKFNASSSGYWNLPFHTAPGVGKYSYLSSDIYSSHFYKKLNSNETYEFVFTNSSLMSDLFSTVDELNAYLVEQYSAGTPVQVCYKFKTPYTIQLTPQQITALSGVNTIYTDADGVIATGAEDPKHTITELKNAINSLGGNV